MTIIPSFPIHMKSRIFPKCSLNASLSAPSSTNRHLHKNQRNSRPKNEAKTDSIFIGFETGPIV